VSYHRRPGTAALPRTFVDRWLPASMLDQRDERDRLASTLNRRVAGWNDNEPAVVEAAAELGLLCYFRPQPAQTGPSRSLTPIQAGRARSDGRWMNSTPMPSSSQFLARRLPSLTS
jgi:hypothetical protein